MNRLIFYFFIYLSLVSCSKDVSIPPQKSVCGTPGWQQENWKVKCTVNGTASPDSVIFDVNGGQTQFGSHYYRRFYAPRLPLVDSTNFCGDVNSDINVRLYSVDTTKTFYFSIYVNNVIVKQDTGQTVTINKWTGTFAQCR
jgi:hypothetical protein